MHSRSAFRLKPDPPLPPQKKLPFCYQQYRRAPARAVRHFWSLLLPLLLSPPPAGVCAGLDASLVVGRPAACARVTRCFSTGASPLLLL
jgi:hypothetical protein